ncbi:MAG: 4Fe-4S dicluster domain-containing protein [Candidatus Aminicenantes bacterium]|nr:4Fe-4S dicluster domain-containing protein [Candidatus Aminicenantes bacterium]
MLQALRILSQWAFFALFLYLFTRTRFTGSDVIGPVERFFHFDPLLALTATVAGRALFAAFAWAGATVLLTLVLGRVVCGWVCPLGGVHQFFSFLFKKARLHKPRDVSAGPLKWKYFILLFVLAGALLGLNLAGYLDPLSFLYRSFATAVFPALGHAATGLIKLLYALGVDGPAGTLGQFLETLTLNPVYLQGFFIGLLFLAAVGLNLLRERFWCRVLCPAGALLGLLSLGNVFKLKIDKTKCIDCKLCSLQCQTQAAPYPEEDWKRAECVYCFTCGAVCPTAAVGFPTRDVPRKEKRVSLDRRKILWTPIAALAALPFFRINPAGRRAASSLIRPPGALPEPAFLSRCVKCGECMKACPTGGLQPVLGEAGPEGLWTPRLVPRIGYCEYYCSLCSQVCPTGAIKELGVEEKLAVKIGTAWVDKNRCLPYALGKPCIVCEEHCPTSPKAIKLVDHPVLLPDGTVSVQRAPFVDTALCIGCGICENKCPVMDQPAIYVTSIGEHRSETNRLLLDL